MQRAAERVYNSVEVQPFIGVRVKTGLHLYQEYLSIEAGAGRIYQRQHLRLGIASTRPSDPAKPTVYPVDFGDHPQLGRVHQS